MQVVKDGIAADAGLQSWPPGDHRVGWGFISLYPLAFTSTNLLFLPPPLVTLPLKINALVGIKEAPNSLALVAGIGALVAMVASPFFGRMSDRTTSRLGMRRPWMVAGLAGGSLGILLVALAPNIPVVLVVGMAIGGIGFGVYRRLDVGQFLASGTSLLKLPPGARQVIVRLSGDTPATSFTVAANANALMSTAVVSVDAPTFADAERAAHDMVAPTLS